MVHGTYLPFTRGVPFQFFLGWAMHAFGGKEQTDNNNNLKQKQEQIWNGLTHRIVLVTAILNSVST